MKLDLISPDRLHVSRLNMRYGRTPDVADILPTVRARGIIQPLVVRAEGDGFGIVAGSRRFRAAALVAEETGSAEPLPCAIMEEGDDAAAIEASLIENVARLDPDEVTQWETFTRLIVREGRSVEGVAETFGLPLLAVRRILALGKLLPRLRSLYRRGKIDAATVRQLTLASRDKQKEWMALHDAPDAHAPTGQALKAWLFGGASIPVKHALFDLADYPGEIVTDLFGDEAYFADADAFWAAQAAAIEARKSAYLADGWREVVVLPVGRWFETYEHERVAKAKGGRVYVAVTSRGEVSFHEGWLTRKEAKRLAKGEPVEAASPKRPELTGALTAYVDLHRHAAVRAALLDHPGTALRLMVAHAVVGSALWRVEPERQAAPSDTVAESVRACQSEAAFAARRREALALLGRPPDAATLGIRSGDDHDLTALLERLLALPDAAVMAVAAVAMGETLQAGSAVIEAVGLEVGVAMGAVWQADDALFDLIRDREVLGAIVAEVAGEGAATANAGAKGAVLKGIIRDSLAGENGRERVEGWVPRWMAFPPSAYTPRGGVATVERHARIADLIAPAPEPEPPATAGSAAPVGADEGEGEPPAEVERLAA